MVKNQRRVGRRAGWPRPRACLRFFRHDDYGGGDSEPHAGRFARVTNAERLGRLRLGDPEPRTEPHLNGQLIEGMNFEVDQIITL